MVSVVVRVVGVAMVVVVRVERVVTGGKGGGKGGGGCKDGCDKGGKGGNRW